MLNKSGGKVRLTFKMEQDQVWIGTKERTDKIPMNTIKGVVSEPIEGHEEYHIMVSDNLQSLSWKVSPLLYHAGAFKYILELVCNIAFNIEVSVVCK